MSNDLDEGVASIHEDEGPQPGAPPCVDVDAAALPSAASMRADRPSPDHAEFEARVRPHMSRVYRYCVGLTGDRDLAADVFQDTLVAAWRRFDSYEGRAELGAWLCGIARNQFIDVRRTETRRRGLFDRVVDAWQQLLGADAREADAPLRLAIEHEEVDTLLACLQELPEEFRSAVLLCDVESLSYEEASTALGVPVGTVKSRHARGRAKLRAALEARQQSPIARTTKVTP